MRGATSNSDVDNPKVGMDSVFHQKLPVQRLLCFFLPFCTFILGKIQPFPPPWLFFFHLLLPYSISQVLSGLVIVLTALVAS